MKKYFGFIDFINLKYLIFLVFNYSIQDIIVFYSF